MRPGLDACGRRFRPHPPRFHHILLSNASKYSPTGGVITLYAEPAPDNFVRFGVRGDRGPGIAAENLLFIFEKFYRVSGQDMKAPASWADHCPRNRADPWRIHRLYQPPQ